MWWLFDLSWCQSASLQQYTMHNGKTEHITTLYHTESHISWTNPTPPLWVLCSRHCCFASLYQHPLPRYDGMYSARNLLTVWRNTLPPNSGYKRKIVLPFSLICVGSDPSSSYYLLMFLNARYPDMFLMTINTYNWQSKHNNFIMIYYFWATCFDSLESWSGPLMNWPKTI
jgi:hypothetical protein